MAIRTETINNCVICGGNGIERYSGLTDRLHGVPGNWTYLLCSDCGLMWLKNRPITEDIPALYSEYYTHSRSRGKPAPTRTVPLIRILGKSLLRLGVVDVLSAPTYWKEYWYPKRDKLKFLDVGCGNGHFATLLQSVGWDAYGVDPDEQGVAFARETLGSNVQVGDLESVEFHDEQFDLVRLSHVLEHLVDPIATLKHCFRLLPSEGRLIVTTPNLMSWGHRLVFGESWLHLDPPRHFFLFSAKSLAVLARQAGFEHINISTSGRGTKMTWQTSLIINRYDYLPSDWKRRVSVYEQVIARFAFILETLLGRGIPIGEDLQLIATK